MDCSTPEFLVLHYLPEFAQTHVHWVDDAIQSSYPLLSPSPPAFNCCQNQGLFKWVSSLNQVAKLLKLQLQRQSFQWIFIVDWMVWSLHCSRDSQASSLTPQFKNINCLVFSLLYGWTLTSTHDYWETIAFTIWSLAGKVMSLLFNTLSRFVIAFLSRSKYLNFMATETVCCHFGALQNKVSLFSLFTHLFVMEWWGQMPFSSVQFSHSVVSDSLLPHGLQHTGDEQASLFITNSQSLLKVMPIESVMTSNYLILREVAPIWTSLCPTPSSKRMTLASILKN